MRQKKLTSVSGAAAPSVPWRGALRRHLAALLLMKVAALALLWVLFFSHRAPLDGAAVSRHLLPAQEAPR